MAMNSRKLPRTGWGASVVIGAPRPSHNPPPMASKNPQTVRREMRSPSRTPALKATNNGSRMVIIAAWEALVVLSAAASKRK